MKKIYIVAKQYGNPSVVQLRRTFSKLDDAIQYAREGDESTGRTHTVYESCLNSSLGSPNLVWSSTDEWWHEEK